MGTAVGAVFIRQDVNRFKAEEIIKNIFEVTYAELKEDQLFDPDYEKRYDIRKYNCVTIYKTALFIIIVNSNLVDNLYHLDNGDFIKKIHRYFEKPSQIFAFEEYDSGGTYSYCIITNGRITRYIRAFFEKPPVTFGEPLNIELKFLQAKTQRQKDEDENMQTYYTDPNTGVLHHIDDMPAALLHEVMQHEVGLNSYTMYTQAIEKRYFKLTAMPSFKHHFKS